MIINDKIIRIGLALSGGGYRAAAFHLGTLRALKRLGLLSKIDVISSVSGGSILAASYGLHKDEDFEDFEFFFRDGLKKSSLCLFLINLTIIIAIPILLSILYSSWFFWLYVILIPCGFNIIPSSLWIAFAYDKIFFNGEKLKDLPDSPVIGVNSTNIVTGRLFTFSKQDVGGYDYKKDGKSIITGEDIPISFAVSCSTCVPSFFSPRKISKKYFLSGEYKKSLLVDGGLYDNQGAYILSESSNKLYRTDNIIVSDAGNSEPSAKFIRNTFGLMTQSIEVLMNRIRTIQIRKNIYHNRYESKDDSPKFAYLSLRWDNLESMPNRFVENIKSGYVSEKVLNYHNITKEDVAQLKNKENKTITDEIIRKFKKSIEWNDLLKRMPSKEIYNIAYSVSTNLTPLSESKIDALSFYADWLTELQIKTYLPHLLVEKNE